MSSSLLREDSLATEGEAAAALAAALRDSPDRRGTGALTRAPSAAAPPFTEEQRNAFVDMLLSVVSGSAAARGDHNNMCSSLLGGGACDVDLDYTDSWPSVELSVGINEILRVDVQDLTFDADFVIFLDWVDPKLRRGEHYSYNAEHGKFEFVRTLRDCKDDLRFFNPKISIVNSKQDPEEVDHLPQVFDEVLRDGCDVPWLSKKFHFVGTLACRGVNAKYFPFDLEDLQIRISCHEMAGVTSLGQVRRVQLSEPALRKAWRHKLKDGPWVRARQDDEGTSHMWSSNDLDDYNGLGVGEMKVLAFGGVSHDDGQEYALHIVFCRQWYPRHVFDFLILNLQVFAAIASLYVPFSVDMLASRMSITLTVMLTLVSSASARPPAIESLPYSTLHDTYGQFTLFCVAVVGLGNLVVFQNCWGMYRTAGIDDVYDTTLRMVVNNVSGGMLGDWVCEEGACGASQIDCMIMYICMTFVIVSISVVLTSSQMHRISTLLRIKHEVDGHDQNPGKYSRLVLFSRGFSLFPRKDVASCAAHVALLPSVGLFLRSWRLLRRVKMCFFGCWGKESIRHSWLAEDHMFNGGPSRSNERAKKLPQISRFNVKLARSELFRVLDVGSGEMGFYSYWLDEASGAICSSGTEAKLKYNKNQTFVDQFLRMPSGPEELAQQIIDRFGLTPMLPTSPPRTPMHSSPAATLRNASLMEASTSTPVETLSDRRRFACGRDSPIQPDVALPGTPAIMSDRMTNQPSMDERDRLNSGELRNCYSRESQRSMSKTMNTAFRMGTKKKLILCITGANRQMLRDDVDGRALLQSFVRSVNDRVEKFGAECIAYSPEDVDEAMYELWATEWVVQHGDLSVQHMSLEKAYRNLQGGREDASTTLQEVESEFKDLRADQELRTAYCRAATYSRAAHCQQTPNEEKMPASVPCSAFYLSFEASPPLLRALMRARLFSGTLSAGSGSSQVTLRSQQGLDSSQVHSIPLGNRTPLVSMTVTECHDGSSPFSSSLPKTNSLAHELLCGDSDRRISSRFPPKETRPAWPEDGPVDAHRLELWRKLVCCCAEERGLPQEQRGLYVGISALFYAAKLAGCAGEVMPRDLFIGCLKAKRDELMKDGTSNGRDLANLTLVMSIVEFVLHRTAIIVCKRSWSVGEAGAQTEVVATWTLGMYLKHSGSMGGGANG